MTRADATDPRLILLDEDDNIVAVARPIKAGENVLIDGAIHALDAEVGLGFKLARRAIAADEPIVKHGARIGIATTAIAAGALVHTHNVRSAYLPSTETLAKAGDPS